MELSDDLNGALLRTKGVRTDFCMRRRHMGVSPDHLPRELPFLVEELYGMHRQASPAPCSALTRHTRGAIG